MPVSEKGGVTQLKIYGISSKFNQFICVCVCAYSNSRNDVPRVAQRYGTIAAHTQRRASVLVVFVVFCVHMYSFAGLIRRTSPPTFSDTAITDRHSDTTISSSELTGCGYPGLLDRKNLSDMCPRWESNPRLPACKASTLSTRPGSPPISSSTPWSVLVRQISGS